MFIHLKGQGRNHIINRNEIKEIDLSQMAEWCVPNKLASNAPNMIKVFAANVIVQYPTMKGNESGAMLGTYHFLLAFNSEAERNQFVEDVFAIPINDGTMDYDAYRVVDLPEIGASLEQP